MTVIPQQQLCQPEPRNEDLLPALNLAWQLTENCVRKALPLQAQPDANPESQQIQHLMTLKLESPRSEHLRPLSC